jgi:hypothetical protein
MSHNAAGEDVLGKLHAKVAQVLLAQLDGKPFVDAETGETLWIELDPRFVSIAVTFLNSNKIVAHPYITDSLTEIQKKLEGKTKFTLIKKEAREDALKAMEM